MNLPCYATIAYARIVLETMEPRELEASLKPPPSFRPC